MRATKIFSEIALAEDETSVPTLRTVRILVVSDTVSREIYNERICALFGTIDLVLSCGDLPYDYLEYIVTMLNVPLLYVHGNHDRPLHTEAGDIVLPRGCVSVEGRVLSIAGLLIGGLGGSIRYKPSGEHQYTQWEMRKRLAGMAPKLWLNRFFRGRAIDIFLAHSPPLGIHDQEDPAHQGFAVFRKLIRRYRPRYFIHGHTYYRAGRPRCTRVGGTEVIHVSGHEIIEVSVD
jgi:uncharacterized protein